MYNFYKIYFRVSMKLELLAVALLFSLLVGLSLSSPLRDDYGNDDDLTARTIPGLSTGLSDLSLDGITETLTGGGIGGLSSFFPTSSLVSFFNNPSLSIPGLSTLRSMMSTFSNFIPNFISNF